MKRILAIAIALLAANFAAPSAAQENDTNTDPITIRTNPLREGQSPDQAFVFEYGVPATPALTIIGATGDAIPTTSNLQRFALSALRAADEAGGGMAYGLDFSPYWATRTMSLEQYYRANPFMRRLARSRVSAAFSEGGDTEASRASVGLALAWFNSSDPASIRVNNSNRPFYQDCIGPTTARVSREFVDSLHAAQLERDSARGDDIPAAEAKYQEDFLALERRLNSDAPAIDVITRCANQTRALARRGRSLDLGLAAQWRGEPGRFSDFESAGGTVWATYMTRTIGSGPDVADDDPNFRLYRAAVSLRYDVDAEDTDSNDVRVNYDHGSIALGVERIRPDAQWSVQAAYETFDGPSGSEFDGDQYRYLVRYERRLPVVSNSAWLSVTMGALTDRTNQDDDSYLSIAIRFKAPSRTPIFDSNARPSIRQGVAEGTAAEFH